MREILFRGKQTYDGKWVYGNLIRDDCKNVFIIPQSDFYVDGHHLYYYDESDIPVFIDEHTIGEYTGLMDRNGNKVFEGDIVRVNDKFIDHVVFVSGCFCMERQIMMYEFTYQDGCTIEVIGNDVDNPELLAEE